MIQQEHTGLRERNDQQRKRVDEVLTERLNLEAKAKHVSITRRGREGSARMAAWGRRGDLRRVLACSKWLAGSTCQSTCPLGKGHHRTCGNGAEGQCCTPEGGRDMVALFRTPPAWSSVGCGAPGATTAVPNASTPSPLRHSGGDQDGGDPGVHGPAAQQHAPLAAPAVRGAHQRAADPAGGQCWNVGAAWRSIDRDWHVSRCVLVSLANRCTGIAARTRAVRCSAHEAAREGGAVHTAKSEPKP